MFFWFLNIILKNFKSFMGVNNHEYIILSFILFSGQAAVITPRLVTSGLGARRVKAIAAAKHHTVIATEGGEVFTWGSNRGKNL